jgi:hypothetical protein
MNKQRRKIIEEAVGLLYSADSLLSEVLEEEQEAFDNLTEGLAATERGQAIEAAADMLEGIVTDVQNAISDAEGIE